MGVTAGEVACSWMYIYTHHRKYSGTTYVSSSFHGTRCCMTSDVRAMYRPGRERSVCMNNRTVSNQQAVSHDPTFDAPSSHPLANQEYPWRTSAVGKCCDAVAIGAHKEVFGCMFAIL